MTKTWSVEVIMWQLAGQKGEDKLDPGARDSTIKRLAAFYSTPTVIEDNASSNKVYNLTQILQILSQSKSTKYELIVLIII